MQDESVKIHSPIITQKPIILVGLMGCGKSAIGVRLASALDLPFFDSDAVIVEQEKRPITEIFETSGEAYFRQCERETISNLIEQSNGSTVIATGGGAFINPETRQMLLDNALVIWIYAEFDVLLERVSRKKTRPLLEQGNKADILRDLMEQRYPIYETAHLKVASTDAPHEETLSDLITSMTSYYEQT